MNRLLFWLPGVLILGVLVSLVVWPEQSISVAIAVLLLAAAIGAFWVIGGIRGRSDLSLQ